jgi:diguanylate cyclase (GGDEF)-like protein/PAS domain S-box-containing protein
MWLPALALQALLALLALLTPADHALARELRVGVYDNPPKLQVDSKDQPSGILGDLLQEIARREGWQLVSVPCAWEACLQALQEDRIDLMPDVAWSSSREQLFDFHQIPALHSWSQIFSRSDLPLESMLDLQHRRVVVLEASVQQEYLSTLLPAFGLNTQLLVSASFEEAFRMVASGEADAVAANHHYGERQANALGLRESSLMFQPSRLYYAAGKGRQSDVLDAIDLHLKQWQGDSGSPYFKLLERWGAPPYRTVAPTALWWTLAGVSALALLALLFVSLLRREVARQTHDLRASEDKLATILNSVDAFIYIKDLQLRYQYANRKVCDFFQRPLAQVIGRGDSAFFPADAVERLQQNDRLVFETGNRQAFEEHNLAPDSGEQRSFLSVKLPLRRPDGQIYALCGISTDITEQRQLTSELERLDRHDSLTLLPNRKQLLQRLREQALAEGHSESQRALLLIDLDNFKDFNDSYSHDKGDRLLQQVAQRLNQCTRSEDLVARLGSDEFAFLLTGLGASPTLQQQVELRAQQVHAALTTQAYQIDEISYRASVSIGVVLLSEARIGVDDILKRADLALLQAKASLRQRICIFQPDMAALASARAALEADLRDGIEKQQFELHYQPQHDADTGVFGFEALVRWRHPERGLVEPNSFIGLAEISGMIEPLGLWILRTACFQIRRWQDSPATEALLLAVNISARQLHHPDFVAQVLGILAETGANPARLELELTESQLVEDLDGAVAKLALLREHGIHISLDDFGSGYSSLNYLARLPLDQLKIDQSFIAGVLLDANAMAIAKAIVDMGRSLNLPVLAEGVESSAQRDALLQLGCRRFQGYLYGRPLPIEALELGPG